MITEDYCSYEVAKLLNEKEFEIDLTKDYWKVGEDGTRYLICSIGAYTSDINSPNAFYIPANSYFCPTHQMAMKWLREVHNIFIIIEPYSDTNCYFSLWEGDNYYENPLRKGFPSYEETVEAALKYCLENLI